MTNHSMKLLNIFIVFQIFSFSSSAQTFIGIDAAVNTSHWTLSLNGSSLNYPNQPGWSAGVPVEFTLSKIFNLCTGIRYANKGTTTIEFIFDNIKLDPVLSINYVEVPVLLKGKFGSEKIQFNPIAGFSAGYGISGRIDDIVGDGNGVGHIHNRSVNFTNDEINRLNIQLHIGAGATFVLSSGKLFFDIQYLHGLTNLSSSYAFENEDSYSVNAHGFELSIGYLFRIGKDNPSETPAVK